MYRTDLINAVMGEKRLTNESLASAAKVSAPTISAIRNGKWDGKLSVLKSVAEALGLRLSDLIKEAA